VPIFGESGKIIMKNEKNHLDTTIQLELSYGLNRIEVSVTNVNGIESLRSPLVVNYTPKSPNTPLTYFIGIGINHFKQDGHDLDFAVKDIIDFVEELKIKTTDKLIIDTLFNQSVTLENIHGIKSKLETLDVHDKVILSYSGHGLLDSELNYYLSSYEVDFINPANGGIPYETIEFLLDSIPCRKKLVLIDACNSGEVDKESRLNTIKTDNSVTHSVESSTKGDLFKALNHFKDPYELINEMFLNIKRGSGTTIITASSGYQSAYEGGNIENGYFTYAILEYFKNNDSVSVNELKSFVLNRVVELSGGKQKPTTRAQNLYVDWHLY
jgi:hypothetical protein